MALPLHTDSLTDSLTDWRFYKVIVELPLLYGVVSNFFQLSETSDANSLRERDKQTKNNQSNKQTDSLTDWCFDREIILPFIMY